MRGKTGASRDLWGGQRHLRREPTGWARPYGVLRGEAAGLWPLVGGRGICGQLRRWRGRERDKREVAAERDREGGGIKGFNPNLTCLLLIILPHI